MSKYGAFFAIQKRIESSGVKLDREDLILSFTAGKKKSLSELSATEYRELLLNLNRSYPTKKHPWHESKENKMRRKVIALFARMDYVKGSRADMARINQWCCVSGMYHKPLNKHNTFELTQLVSQVEKVFKSWMKAHT